MWIFGGIGAAIAISLALSASGVHGWPHIFVGAVVGVCTAMLQGRSN